MDNNDFFKDKRKRETTSDRTDKRPRTGGQRREEAPRKPFSGGKERRSFNPNFTSDNKLREGGESKPRYSDDKPRYSDRPRTEGKPRFGDKPRYEGDKPRYSDRPRNDDRPRRDGEKPRFGDKPYRDGDKPRFGEGKPRFGDKPKTDGKPRFGDKPYRDGEKPRFGEGKPRFGEKSRFGDKARKPFGKPGDKPKGKKTRVHGENPDGTYPTFAPPVPTGEVRLNRHIAASGRCSRRDADQLIRDGHVTVNGTVVTEMGFKVAPTDVVELDGKSVGSEKQVYILMNKPKGFVTTLEDPHADKTVIDLLGNNVRERVYPVGRLDKNSLGVLLLTNDGDLTSRLTHPSHNKKKIYQATLDRALTHADMQQIADGLTLEDGPVQVDAIDYVGESRKDVGLEIHSGRNRVVRRIFEHLGYKVTKLDRVYFAGLTKRNLKRGQWRFLTPTEVDMLRSGMYE
jgi:23S rRNA pseudouridine2605 synthase